MNGELKKESVGEEIANAITHGIGAFLSIAALVLLIIFPETGSKTGFYIFGITLVLLYLTSTLYHAIPHAKTKRLFRKFDHMAIFLLIAGTYTPFCLTVLDGWISWTILSIVWASALLGIFMKLFFTGKYEWISLLAYIATGWAALLVIKPLYNNLSVTGFVFLLVGGVAYTAGTYFYANEKIRYNHSIWHVFVLTGSVFHFFAIMTFAGVSGLS
ncbi:MAG TPA: hemolysin III family protein [Ohtaekwangia sp.]|nr:hemolysin III family protein [Ohtaekwangia sp.]